MVLIMSTQLVVQDEGVKWKRTSFALQNHRAARKETGAGEDNELRRDLRNSGTETAFTYSSSSHLSKSQEGRQRFLRQKTEGQIGVLSQIRGYSGVKFREV